MRNIIDIYTEVAQKLDTISEKEQAVVVQGLAGTYHRTRLQALLDDLKSTSSIYSQIENSSSVAVSNGSASRENDEYLKSLQARINKLKNEAQLLAVTIGEAFLSSGMVEFFTVVTSGLKTITSLVSSVGALPTAFVAINAILFLCSSSFRGLTASIGGYAIAAIRGQASTTALTGKLKALQATAQATGFTMKGALASTGIGLALVGIGAGFEYLAKKQEDSRRRAEELETQNKQLKESYENNADSVDSIVGKLESYEQAMQAGELDLSGEKEYVRLKNELASLLPSLSLGTNSYGDAILGNSTAIKSQLGLLQNQIDKEKELKAIKEAADAKEKIANAEKDIKSYGKTQNQNKNILEFEANDNRNINKDFGKVDLSSIKETTKVIEVAQKRLEQMRQAADQYASQGQSSMAEKAKKDADAFEQALGTYVGQASQIMQANTQLNNSYATTAVAAITTSKAMKDGSKDFVNAFISSVNSVETEGEKLKSFYSSLEISVNTDKFKDAFGELDSVISDFTSAKKKFEVGEIDTKQFEESRKVLEAEITKVRNMLVKLAEEKGIDTSSFLASFDASISSLLGFERAVDEANLTVEQASQATSEYSSEVGGLGDTANETAEKLKQFSNAAEAMVGASSQMLSSIDNAIYSFQIMSGKVQENSIQSAYLQQQLDILIAQYPELASQLNGTVKQQEQAIKTIEIENNARKVLLDAYTQEVSEKLSGEGKKTRSAVQGTQNRISAMRTEINALSDLMKAWKKYADAANEAISESETNAQTSSANDVNTLQQEKLSVQANNKIKELKKSKSSATANIDKELASLDSLTGSLTQHVESAKEAAKATDTKTGSTNKATDATSKNTAETKKNTVENLAQKESLLALNTVLDKYKNQLSEIDLRLTKLNNIQNKYAKDSKEYRNAIKKEIELTKAKIDILNKQYKEQKKVASLEASMEDPYKYSEYDSGSSGPSGGSVNYSSSGGSSYNGSYASIINSTAKKYGVDPALIAGIIKQESNFNPNAKSHVGATGLMQLMPATARSLGVKNSSDPTQNIEGGTKYIAQMLKQFGGDLEKALRAYNAGPGNVLNGKAYQFKETNDYVRKVTANYNNYKKNGVSDSSTKALNNNTKALKNNTDATSKTVKTQKRKLSGWAGGQITNGWGASRSAASLTGGKHIGVDISYAGIYGKALESNVAGKVKFAGRKSGNVGAVEGQKVVIIDSSGKEHSYKHLKDINVKAGDQVAVGSKIGSVGGKYKSEGTTIKSRYGHLHYDVRDKNGKWIDPTNFAKAAMGKVTTGGVENLTGGSYLSDIDSSATGVTDKSSYLSIKEQALELQNQIREYISNLVESYLSIYETKIDKWNDRTAVFEAGQSKYSTHSTKYRKYNNNILANEKKVYRATQAEANDLKSIIQSGEVDGYKLSQAQIEEFKDKLRELNVSLAEQTVKIKELRFDTITSKLESFANAIEKSERAISLSQAKQNKVTSDSKRYRQLQNEIIKENRKEYKQVDKQARYASQQLSKENKRTSFSPSKKKDVQNKQKKYASKANDYQDKVIENKNRIAKSKITFTSKDQKRLDELNKKKKLTKKETTEKSTLTKNKKIVNEKIKFTDSDKKRLDALAKKDKDSKNKKKDKNGKKIEKLTQKEIKEKAELIKKQKNDGKKKYSLTKKEISELEKAIKEDRSNRDKNKKAYKKYTDQLKNNGKLLTAKDKEELEKQLEELRIQREEKRLAIAEAMMNKVQSYRDSFAYQGSVREYAINRDTYKRNQTDSGSSKYRNLTTENIKNIKSELALKRREMNLITQQLTNTSLLPAQLRELREALRQLKLEVYESYEAIQEERDARLRSSLEANQNKIDEYSYLQSMSEIYQSQLTEDTPDYNAQKSKQADYISKQIELMKANADSLYAAAQNTEFSVEQRKGYLQEWRDLRMSMANMVKDQLDANKQIADDYVALMKKGYEKKRDMALKAIDDERTAYSKLINDMIKAIDDSEKKLSHEEERTDRTDEIKKKKKKIDTLAMDDSLMAKAERKKLQEELAELEKDYAKWERQYNNEQKKEALQEQLEEKNEQLDKEQKAVERYYENILEDERRWKKMSEDILKGHIDTYIKEFQEMGIYVTNNLEGIGESIGTSLVDKFNEAIEKMKNLKTETEHYQSLWEDMMNQGFFEESGSYNPEESKPPSTNDSQGNMKYVANKDLKLTANKDGSGESFNVEEGKVVTVTQSNDGKAYVKLQDGREGWTSMDNLTNNHTTEKEFAKTRKEAKLYTSASQESTALGKIAADTKLEITGKSGDFYKVKYNGQEGYVHKNNMDSTSGYETSQTTTTHENTYDKGKTEKEKDYSLKYAQEDVVIRNSASDSGKVVDNFKAGKALKMENGSDKNGWVQVVWNDGKSTGWVKKSTLGAEKPSTPNVTGESSKGNENKRKVTERSPMYKQNDSNGDYFGKIDPNEKVELVGKALATGLQKIKYNNKTGWINAQKLKRFDSGGFTGNWSGNEGKIAMLHKKELVLNNDQTSHILEVAKLLTGFKMPSTPQIKTPDINFPTNDSPVSDMNFETLVKIENFNGTQKEADKLSKTLMNSLSKAGANILRK